MDFNSMYLIMDLICVGYGLYILYLTVKMKNSGKLEDCSSLLPKSVSPNKCKDPAGFINFIFVKQMLAGLVAVLAGAVGMMQTYTDLVTPYVFFGVILLLVAYLVFYGIQISKAVKMFW